MFLFVVPLFSCDVDVDVVVMVRAGFVKCTTPPHHPPLSFVMMVAVVVV